MPNLPLDSWDQPLLHLLRVRTLSHLLKLGVVRDYLINIPNYVSQYCHLAWEFLLLLVRHQDQFCLDYKICPWQQVRRVSAPQQIQP